MSCLTDNPIGQVRLLVQDNTPGFYMISDEEINFLLDRNNRNVNKAALEAARIILFQLSMRGDETVDIFTIRGSRSADQYRLALQMFIKDPTLNPILETVQGYFGGVSKSDMQANDSNPDNATVPTTSTEPYPNSYFDV